MPWRRATATASPAMSSISALITRCRSPGQPAKLRGLSEAALKAKIALEALPEKATGPSAKARLTSALPPHAVRPVACWSPKETPIAVAQTSGRPHLDALDRL